MSGYAALLLRRFKLTLSEDSPAWSQLCLALWQAERGLLEAALVRSAGGWVDTPVLSDPAVFLTDATPDSGVSPLLASPDRALHGGTR